MILESYKVFYAISKAKEIAMVLQKNDMEWNYVVREGHDLAYIEVLDSEGYHLGYM